jgi:hypothetical protein
MSLINILKNRAPGQIPDEHRRELQTEREEHNMQRPEISGWISNS